MKIFWGKKKFDENISSGRQSHSRTPWNPQEGPAKYDRNAKIYKFLNENDFVYKSTSDLRTGRELIFVSENYFRPAEVEELMGDSTKASSELGWKPEYSFDDLVKEIVGQDCK